MEGTYDKGGSAGSKGVDYQVGLSSVFLLNALRTLKDWRLSTENKKAGKFDDIVLELYDNRAILLQAKHKEKTKKKKITLTQLLCTDSKNDDFSIPKYFFSYLEAKKSFTIKTVIVCTNAHVDKTALPFLRSQRLNSDSMLHCEGSNCFFYTLKEEMLPHLKENAENYYKANLKGKEVDETVITENNFKDFFKSFQLFFGYPPENNLESVIERLLFNLKCSHSFWDKASPQDVLSKVKNWFQQPKGEYLTVNRSKAIFCEIRSDKFCQTIEQYKLFFNTSNSMFTNSTRIFHVIADGGYLLQAMRVHHALKRNKEKVLYVSPDDDIEVQKMIIETFRLPQYTFLTIISPKCTKDSDLCEMCNKVTEILEMFYYKKVILVTEQKSKLAQQMTTNHQNSDIIKPVTFDDLSKDTQNKLWKKSNIIFQGNSISLKEIIGVKDCSKSIDSETLEKLVKNDIVEVGIKPSTMKEDISRYYVEREFQKRMKRNHKMETIGKSEKDICNVDEKLILISDSAGMGKSTVLTRLAAIMKKKHPHLWIIRIELSDYTQILRDCLKKNINTVSITEVLDSREDTRLKSQFERLIFSMDEKVVLMLDGVDEVSPNYTGLILSLLSQCNDASNLAKVFVTTRPHVTEELEAHLKVTHYMLEHFTKQNQIDFLTNYWVYNLKLDDADRNKCVEYANALTEQTWENLDYEVDHITAIPLQLRMMAEIFQENNEIEGPINWKGCKEYIISNGLELSFSGEMNFTTLYKMFIEKKRDVFIDKADPNGNCRIEIIQALMDAFDNCLDYHRFLALEVMLDQTEYELFSCYHKRNDNAETDMLRMGIVQKLNGNLRFIHKTFAEYFLAQTILKEIQKENPNAEFQRFFIDCILICADFKVVRKFLDSMLQEVVCSLPSNTFQNYQSLEQETGSTEEYNTSLVHLLAREGCVGILQLIFKCISFNAVRDKEIYVRDVYRMVPKNIPGKTLNVIKQLADQGGVNIKDEIGWTPLHYAVQSRRLEMIEFLLKYGANVNCKDDEGQTPLHIATSYRFALIEEQSRKRDNYLKTSNVNSAKQENEKIRLEEALSFKIIKYLVEQGANIKERDRYKRNALQNIVRYSENVEIILFLIDKIYEKGEWEQSDRIKLFMTVSVDAIEILQKARPDFLQDVERLAQQRMSKYSECTPLSRKKKIIK